MAHSRCATRTHRTTDWPSVTQLHSALSGSQQNHMPAGKEEHRQGQNRDISRQTVSTELSMPSEINGLSADFLWKWNVHDHLHKCPYCQPAISNLHRYTVPLYDPVPVCRHYVAVRYLNCCLSASVRQIAFGFTSRRRKQKYIKRDKPEFHLNII